LNGKDVRIGTCIYAGDIKKLAKFYEGTLGFETHWMGEDFVELKTASGALSFFMYSREQFVKALGENYDPPSGINQTFEIAFWLPNFADVDEEYGRLSKLDVEFPMGEPITYPFGIRNFYVADPEGNLLEIGSMEVNL
jgi:lactoylglutathione lyase